MGSGLKEGTVIVSIISVYFFNLQFQKFQFGAFFDGFGIFFDTFITNGRITRRWSRQREARHPRLRGQRSRNKKRYAKNVAKRHGFITLKSITSNSWVFSLIIIFIRSSSLNFLKTSIDALKRIGLYFTKTTRCFETIGSSSLRITHVLCGFVSDALRNDNLVTLITLRLPEVRSVLWTSVEEVTRLVRRII